MCYENPFLARAFSRNTLAACLMLSSGFTCARNERHDRICAIAAPQVLDSPPAPIVLFSDTIISIERGIAGLYALIANLETAGCQLAALLQRAQRN
jgi:hypothetical protein